MKNATLLAILLVVLFFQIYLLKVYRGVDLFRSFTLSDKIPMALFIRAPDETLYIDSSAVNGTIFDENFDQGFVQNGWSGLWSREPGTVIRRTQLENSDATHHLYIQSLSEQDWAVFHDLPISVRQGMEYVYQVQARTKGNTKAEVSLVLYDQDKSILSWNSFASVIPQGMEWSIITKSFPIPELAAFMTLRITGKGVGQVHVNTISLIRITPSQGSEPLHQTSTTGGFDGVSIMTTRP